MEEKYRVVVGFFLFVCFLCFLEEGGVEGIASNIIR